MEFWVPQWLRINSLYRIKSPKNQIAIKKHANRGRREGRTAMRARQHGRATPTTSCNKHHEKPVVVIVPNVLRFSTLLRRLLFLARGICYGVSVLGHFGPS